MLCCINLVSGYATSACYAVLHAAWIRRAAVMQYAVELCCAVLRACTTCMISAGPVPWAPTLSDFWQALCGLGYNADSTTATAAALPASNTNAVTAAAAATAKAPLSKAAQRRQSKQHQQQRRSAAAAGAGGDTDMADVDTGTSSAAAGQGAEDNATRRAIPILHIQLVLRFFTRLAAASTSGSCISAGTNSHISFGPDALGHAKKLMGAFLSMQLDHGLTHGSGACVWGDVQSALEAMVCAPWEEAQVGFFHSMALFAHVNGGR